jgi:outer membrane murein-binding lipoprotein Lpp
LAAALKGAGVGPDTGAYSESAVSNWIKGRTRPPADVVLAAAALHGLSLDAALGGTPASGETPSMSRASSDVDDLRAAVARLEMMVLGRTRSDEGAPPRLRDLTGVYPTRSDAQAAVPLLRTIASAERVEAMGLSLNAICQGISDVTLRELIENGLTLHCLFLDPDGAATRAREDEEGFPPQHLSEITRTNIHALERVRDALTSEAGERLQIRTYDEPIRFNITLIDRQRAFVQLYLGDARGLDSPTLQLESRDDEPHGLFPVFEQVLETTWERASALPS